MLKKMLIMLVDDSGQGLVEYALIIALVSVVAIVALRALGTNAGSKITSAGNALT